MSCYSNNRLRPQCLTVESIMPQVSSFHNTQFLHQWSITVFCPGSCLVQRKHVKESLTAYLIYIRKHLACLLVSFSLWRVKKQFAILYNVFKRWTTFLLFLLLACLLAPPIKILNHLLSFHFPLSFAIFTKNFVIGTIMCFWRFCKYVNIYVHILAVNLLHFFNNRKINVHIYNLNERKHGNEMDISSPYNNVLLFATFIVSSWTTLSLI